MRSGVCVGNRTVPSAYLGWLSSILAPGPADQRQSSQAPSRDFVLGAATGYGVADIAPFVRSLRSVYQGEVALVVDEGAQLSEFLDAHGVEVIPTSPTPAWSPHPVMTRFAAFNHILSQRPDLGSVLLTDVRDVIFQSNPFHPEPGPLELFVEFEHKRLADHAFNRKHLRALVGEELTASIADRPCLCVGTIMGSRANVSRFCRTILMLGAIPRSHVGGAFGADQAACNLAAHLGLVEHEIVANYGRVATVGLTPSDQLAVRGGTILNPDGSASPIVHQYDRHPLLMNEIHARWGAGLERRERARPITIDHRAQKFRTSVLRRLPELR